MPKKEDKATVSSIPTPPTSARLLKNRPLDPHSDDVEVRPKQAVFADAAAELGPEQLETPQQAELLAPPEEAKRPNAVQNGRMLATYVGLHLERDKNNEKLICLDFSFPLEEAHNGYLPGKVKAAWDFLKESENKLIQVQGIPAVTLDLYLDPKEKKAELHLRGAEFSRAVIQLIEEVGKGKAKMVTRFSFRLRVERDKDTVNFAAWSDGQEYWLKMPATQKSIGE